MKYQYHFLGFLFFILAIFIFLIFKKLRLEKSKSKSFPEERVVAVKPNIQISKEVKPINPEPRKPSLAMLAAKEPTE
jgi:hypothetical protein